MKSPMVTIEGDDYVDTLDRILDKGIVVDQYLVISQAGVFPLLPVFDKVRIERISIQPFGASAIEIDAPGDLFPYWRRDLWTK